MSYRHINVPTMAYHCTKHAHRYVISMRRRSTTSRQRHGKHLKLLSLAPWLAARNTTRVPARNTTRVPKTRRVSRALHARVSRALHAKTRRVSRALHARSSLHLPLACSLHLPLPPTCPGFDACLSSAMSAIMRVCHDAFLPCGVMGMCLVHVCMCASALSLRLDWPLGRLIVGSTRAVGQDG